MQEMANSLNNQHSQNNLWYIIINCAWMRTMLETRAKKNVKIVKSNISIDFYKKKFIENILNIFTFKGKLNAIHCTVTGDIPGFPFCFSINKWLSFFSYNNNCLE